MSAAPAATPGVDVLMCTFRGEAHLPRQLQSIAEQTERRWRLFVSDDGSDDGTLPLLEAFRQQQGPQRVRIFSGPRRGFAANFFSLISRPEVDGEFAAFTDQDDEWAVDKLARATACLSRLPAGTPGLYGSTSVLVDAAGSVIGGSRCFRRRPSFANALVQNMATGNTMVLNREALALMRRAGTGVQVSAHDWWAYLLVMGCGGTMVYDTQPSIRYRQHGHNLYGANTSLVARWQRLTRLFRGDFRDWNALNVAALRSVSHLLTPESLRQLEHFERVRHAPWALRPLQLWRSAVYRQTWDGQLALYLAAFTNRI